MYAGISGPQLTFRANNNLEGLKYRVVTLNGSLNNVNLAAAGNDGFILTNDPRSGENAAVSFFGETKVQAGSGGLTINQFFAAAASGYAVGVASGAAFNGILLGKALTAAASGSLASVLLYKLACHSGQAL